MAIHINLSAFKLLLLSMLLLAWPAHAQSDSVKMDLQTKRAMRHIKFWNNMIPRYTKLQFAGSMGMISIGSGWNYGKDHWETDVLFGLVPRHSNDEAMLTFTLKQNYMPWRWYPYKNIMVEPLACGFYINSVLNGSFWTDPDRYPKGYYWFSTRIRNHVYLGERITLALDKKWPAKSLTFFYELSTCDLYIISRVKNHVLRPRDYLSLSFGLKMQIF